MSNATVVKDVEWKQWVSGALDPSETESEKNEDFRQETPDNAFQFFYGVPEEMNRNVEFIPFYGQSDSAAAHGGRKIPVDEKESPEDILKRSYAEGFAKGEKEGFETGNQKADPVVERIQAILHEIDGLWQQLVQTYEEKIIQLISRVAEKVVLGQVAVDHDTVKRVILDTFRMIPESVEVTIDIHPEDVEHIENIKEEFFQQLKTLKHISLLPDPSVSPGGCRVKTRFGEVDATLESRLDVVQETIMNVYRNKGGNDQ